jgi:hypothetical protein
VARRETQRWADKTDASLQPPRPPIFFFYLPSAGSPAASFRVRRHRSTTPGGGAPVALRCRGGRVGGGHASTAAQAEAKLDAPEEVPCAARTTIMRIRESLRGRLDDVRWQGRLVWKGHQGLRVLPAVGGPATVPSPGPSTPPASFLVARPLKVLVAGWGSFPCRPGSASPGHQPSPFTAPLSTGS